MPDTHFFRYFVIASGLWLMMLMIPLRAVALPVGSSDEGSGVAEALSFQVNEHVVPFDTFAVSVMPGETVDLHFASPVPGRMYYAHAAEGRMVERRAGEWTWTAPQTPGYYPLSIGGVEGAIQLQVFVKRPYDNAEGWLNGFQIGHYAEEPRNGDPQFLPPSGFIEVHPEMEEIPVSPHFTLGEFLCKQTSGYPKYVLVDERLILKLEHLLRQAKAEGLTDRPFHIMSAFRTPYYNRKIGNRTTYSSHLFGMAADIFIDTNGDGRMDDLTGSGRVTVEDANLLAGFVEEQTEEEWFDPFMGGLGIYGPRPHRGPFIHVDVRGEPARW